MHAQITFGRPTEINPAVKALNNDSVLAVGTEVKSRFERIFKRAILDLGISSCYEPYRFKVMVPNEQIQSITYTPDFVAELLVCGRQVILEPHSLLFQQRRDMHLSIRKYARFKEQWGSMFYLVLASDMEAGIIESIVQKPASAFSDEYWFIRHMEKAEEFRSASEVRMHLQDLVRRSGPQR